MQRYFIYYNTMVYQFTHHIVSFISPYTSYVYLSCTRPCFSVRTWFHDKGLIINNDTMFYMLDTRFINGQGGRVPYFMVTSSIITTFAVNAYSRLIYFADAKTNSIYELSFFTQRFRLVTSTGPAAGNNPKTHQLACYLCINFGQY